MLPELHLRSTKTSCSCSCSLRGSWISRAVSSLEMVQCEPRNPLAVPLQAGNTAASKHLSKWPWTGKILHLAHGFDASCVVFIALSNTCLQPLLGEERPKAFSVPKWEGENAAFCATVSHCFDRAPPAQMGLNLVMEHHFCSHSYFQSPMALQKNWGLEVKEDKASGKEISVSILTYAQAAAAGPAMECWKGP